jgi:hypothetical protein
VSSSDTLRPSGVWASDRTTDWVGKSRGYEAIDATASMFEDISDVDGLDVRGCGPLAIAESSMMTGGNRPRVYEAVN